MTFSLHFNRDGLTMPRRPRPERHRLAQLWQAMLDRFAPYGYQDEAGFHLGVAPQSMWLAPQRFQDY